MIRHFTLGVCMTAILAATAAEQGLPQTSIPASLGIQSKNHSCSTQDIAEMGEAGLRFMRRGFYWSTIEPEAGSYDFSEYDRLLADADRAGMRVVGCLFGNNTLHEDDKRGGIQTEAGRAGFAAWAAACAQHFAGRGIIWEVWNEPNVRTFWRKDGTHNSDEFAAEYTALVKAVVPAMRATDPDCLVLAGSLSCFWEPSFSWTNACFRDGIAESGISGWSVHPYGVKRPEDFTAGYQRIREILTSHGAGTLPLLNTERGFALGKHFNQNHAVQNEGWSGGPEARTQEFQAWHVARQFLVDQMNDIRLTIWYEWSAQPGAKEDFGLVAGAERRPAYTTLQTLVERLSGFRFEHRIDVGSELDYVLLFTDETGATRLVAWTAPPEGGTPETFVAHDLELGTTLDAPPSAVDALGRPAAPRLVEGVLALPLSGCPLIVDLPSTAAVRTR